MENKVVLVTGAARRVGRTIATWFAAREHDVVVHYGRSQDDALTLVAEIHALGQRAIAVHADLADAAALDALIDAAYAEFGRLDVLVNCASAFEQDHFPDFDVATFDASWAINGRAPILLARAYCRNARERMQTGVVINVVDQKVRDNFHADHFTYTVGKAMLGNMTQMLAISAAPTLRVNAVCPGLMLPSDVQTEQDFRYASRRATPLARVASAEDLAAAIGLLAGPAYNGVDFVVDAGQNLRRVNTDVLYMYRDPAGDLPDDEKEGHDTH
ncbi:MAG TPA: SDR family NAD(P)-dependent oxidoreductase [Pararobbsia sp.]|nr:SDR family NAD(P)-dependent oxidoreductase [Pararobbsia sp.]